jgi:hypothetical protein
MNVDRRPKTGRSLRRASLFVSGALFLSVLMSGHASAVRASGKTQAAASTKWSATGMLFESCTCAVPCTCNFGQGPSPNHYCHSVFAYKLDKAVYNGIDLSGLVIVGSDGPKGTAGVLDDRATATQRPALEALGVALFGEGGPARAPRRWQTAKITATHEGNDLRLAIDGFGGFAAQVLIGRDGKTPVIVANNMTWPIKQAIKAKASKLTFHDADAGDIDTAGVNANYGAFSFPEIEAKEAPAR